MRRPATLFPSLGIGNGVYARLSRPRITTLKRYAAMKKIFAFILKQRIFFIFLTISFVLWYIGRLSHNYTARIPLSIELTTNSRSDYWIEDPKLSINVSAEGDGRLLALYQLGLKSELQIESSALHFIPTQTPYQYTISVGSLIRALAKREPRLSIVNVEDSVINIRLSKLASKRVAVENQIVVNCRRQYMIVGGVKLSFDSVDVKAPEIILDTMQYIPTEQVLFDDRISSISGKAALLYPENVYGSKTSVNFTAEVAGFTEMQFDLPIGVKNMPGGKSAFIVPSSTVVKVQVPLDKYTQDIKPQASIDYNDAVRLGASTPIIIDSLPRWAEIVYMRPKFVEPLFQKKHD